MGIDLSAVSIGIFVALATLLTLGVPLAFSSGAIAVVLCLWFFGVDALFVVGSRTVSFLDSYVLVAVPFFIFMASALERSGLARDLYDGIRLWTGRMPGGAAVVTTFFGVIIGAIIGVAGGEIVLMGLVTMPQLLRLGYDRKMTIGLVCATGALGSMIPPAITLVFFGLTAGISVADLFTASFIPGLMLAGFFIAYVMIRCWLDPSLGPPPPEHEIAMPVREKLRRLKPVALPVLVILGTLGSIYLGLASVTESAAVGAMGTILAVWARGELSLGLLRAALIQTFTACGMVIWLVLGTNALIGVYNIMGGTEYAKGLLTNLPFPPLVVILFMVAIWIVLDFFMDWIGILILTVPIFLPTVVALGYDPIWFGTVFNLTMQVAYLSPPFAPACFYLKSVAPPDMSLDEIFAAMWPWMGLQALALILVILFPEITLWLPRVL